MTDREQPRVESSETGFLSQLETRAVELDTKRRELEEAEQKLLREFKTVFGSTMVEISPGLQAVIKPSKRQGVEHTGRAAEHDSASTIFWAGERSIRLNIDEDYILLNETHALNQKFLANTFLQEVLTELE
jgi:hypothetical protein